MTCRILDYMALTAKITATIVLIYFCCWRIPEFAILSGDNCIARVSRFELYTNFERVQHYERYLCTNKFYTQKRARLGPVTLN